MTKGWENRLGWAGDGSVKAEEVESCRRTTNDADGRRLGRQDREGSDGRDEFAV